MKANIVIEKDGEGYLARVENHQNLFAFAYHRRKKLLRL